MNKKQMAGYKAAEYIKENMIVGLGTGTTAYYLVEKLGKMVKKGFKVKGVATSKKTEKQAEELNIPLVDVDDAPRIDLAIDGVDEVDQKFNAIKGGGGALLREKMIATIAKEVIWIMDDSKLVEKIGKFPLPVEIIPFGYLYVIDRLDDLNLNPVLRMEEGAPFVSDNGNYIIDLQMDEPINVDEITYQLSKIVGVVENGLFLNICDRIVIGTNRGAKVIENPYKS